MKEQVRLGRIGFLEMNVIRMGRGGTAYVRVSDMVNYIRALAPGSDTNTFQKLLQAALNISELERAKE